MRAAFVTKYGGPEVLEIQEAPVPQPLPGQILVKVFPFERIVEAHRYLQTGQSVGKVVVPVGQ